jgi:hypothetical protein
MKNKQIFLMILVCSLMMPQVSFADDTEKDGDDRSIFTTVLMYIPNRCFDVMDIFRARVRVGPGFTASARVTRLANVAAGTHSTFFIGLPGPRNRSVINLPVGIENFVGAEVSVINASNDNRTAFSPSYGTAEVGVGTQIGLLGFDIGADPLEALDFILGVFCIDVKKDDL